MIKNIFYYWFGIVIMTLVKIKTKIFGYIRPRPISKRKTYKNLAYDNKVINDLKKRLTEILGLEYDFNGKNILEIGPGPDLGTGLLFKTFGAAHYTGVDRFELVNDNDVFYDSLLASLGDNQKAKISGTVGLIKEALKKNRKEISLPGFEYLNVPVEEISEKLNLKYDFIFSNAVLEHVENPTQAFKAMFEALRAGGLIYHEIDFQTHTGCLRDRDPLNILRYEKKIYDIFKCAGSPNRLRLDDYIEIAEEQGFKDIKHTITNKIRESEAMKAKDSLAAEFMGYPLPTLGVLSAALVAVKNKNE